MQLLRNFFIDNATNYGEEFRQSRVIVETMEGKGLYKGKAKDIENELLDTYCVGIVSSKGKSLLIKAATV